MSGNRKGAEKYLIDLVNKIDPTGLNGDLLKNVAFKNMSDEEFHEFMLSDRHVVMTVPNNGKVEISIERNKEIAEEIGVKFFQRVIIPAKDGVPKHLTPNPQLVIHNPVRRQAQMLDKKISIPTDNNTIDNLTGQPTGTGRSKGASLSLNEVQVLNNLDLPHAISEFISVRGGDSNGFHAMNTMMARTGTVSLKAIEPYRGEVKSKTTLRSLLLGMMLKATI
jgi:hypothetical protein